VRLTTVTFYLLQLLTYVAALVNILEFACSERTLSASWQSLPSTSLLDCYIMLSQQLSSTEQGPSSELKPTAFEDYPASSLLGISVSGYNATITRLVIHVV
jgi:hypothetical protein